MKTIRINNSSGEHPEVQQGITMRWLAVVLFAATVFAVSLFGLPRAAEGGRLSDVGAPGVSCLISQ